MEQLVNKMPVGASVCIRIVVIGLCSPQGDNMMENSQRILMSKDSAKNQVYLASAVMC